MADPRTFTLIGEFKDGITPELEKINKQLATLKANFAGVGSRKNTGFRGATKEIGKLVSAHKNLAESIKEVQGELRSSVGVLQQYRREMGKAAAATRAFQKAGGNMGGDAFAKNMRAANTEAQRYLRTLQQINSQSGRAPRMPRGGGGMGGRGRGGRGGAPGNAFDAFPMAEFTLAMGVSQAISQPITSAIVKGFEIGVGLMTKPFEYFGNAFGERVQDQLSDLQAAGGLFSISKRSKTPFLSTMQEAIQYQQDTNKVFANMAGTLPGVTNDYVQVGKRLSDTVARVVSGDFENSLKQANAIRNTEEGRQFYVKKGESATITGQSAEARRQVMTTLLGDMTKFTTLAGIGGRTGAGGVTGAYGLPGLTERMIGQSEVSVSQFQRYASVFSNPMVSDALKRNVDLINKTVPDTAARVAAMRKLLQEIVTPEMIDELRTSVDGVYQGLKASLFDPDKGLFGLGRQFTNFGKAMNGYGQYVDKAGNVVKTMTEAADADLSLFEIVANIFSNFGQVLQPIVDFLPDIFDPLKKVASLLKDARYYTGELARTFNTYRESLITLSKTGKYKYLQGSIDIRASLGAINNMMRALGIISKADFKDMGAKLMSKDFKAGPAISEMIDKVLNSDIASGIGKTIGEIVGTVLTEVAKVTGFFSQRVAGSSKLFKGLKAGFDGAKGGEAIKNIFQDVFKSMFNLLGNIAKVIPLEAYVIAGMALILPVMVQTLTMGIGQFISQALFDYFKGGGGKNLGDMLRRQLSRFMGTDLPVQEVKVQDMGNSPKALAGATKGGPLAKAMSGVASFFTKLNNYFKGVGPRFMGFFKGILGKLSIFGAILTSVTSLFQGKDLATSLAAGAGPLFGAALGAALIPFFGPIGPAIGSLIGGLIGNTKGVTEPLTVAFQDLGTSLTTIGSLLAQIGSDLAGLVRAIPGVSKEFDVLRGVMTLLLAPLSLLKLAIYGIYEAYLNIKEKVPGGGLTPEERAQRDEIAKARRTDYATLQNNLDPRSLKDQIAGVRAAIKSELSRPGGGNAKQQEEWRKNVQGGKAPNSEAYFALQNRLKQLYDKEQALRDPKKNPPPTPGKPPGATPTTTGGLVPSAPSIPAASAPQIAATATATAATAAATGQISQKAAVQIAQNTQTNVTLGTIKTVMGTLGAKLNAINATIQNGNMAIVGAINNAAASGGLGGMGGMGGGMFNLPGGDGVKKVVSAGKLLQGMGLNVAENPYFGTGKVGKHAFGSYHYAGRAIDVTGPPAQLDAAYAKLKGTNPAELLWRTAGHYDHLHVAYALGAGNGVAFNSLKGAQSWENSMVPGSVKVGSVTSNSAEGFGGATTVTNNITINQQAGQDANELAAIVAMKIGEAVADARSSSIFV